MPRIKVTDNTKDYIKFLKKKHGGLAIVSADTVNTAAKIVERRYQKELDTFILRNKFTRGAIGILKSKPQSKRTGEFRPIKDINSIVGVRKLKGGKDHYLLSQEVGDTKRGHGKTKGFVPVPTVSARTGKSQRKPIKGTLRLQNSAAIQTLKVAGKPLGVPGSRFKNRQSWAIFHKYSGTAESPNRNAPNRYGWNLSKQFFFRGLKQGISQIGIFLLEGKKVTMTRVLQGKTVKIRARHKFSKAVTALTPTMMRSIFKRSADKFLRG